MENFEKKWVRQGGYREEDTALLSRRYESSNYKCDGKSKNAVRRSLEHSIMNESYFGWGGIALSRAYVR